MVRPGYAQRCWARQRPPPNGGQNGGLCGCKAAYDGGRTGLPPSRKTRVSGAGCEGCNAESALKELTKPVGTRLHNAYTRCTPFTWSARIWRPFRPHQKEGTPSAGMTCIEAPIFSQKKKGRHRARNIPASSRSTIGRYILLRHTLAAPAGGVQGYAGTTTAQGPARPDATQPSRGTSQSPTDGAH